jgi:hypothetical protein
LTKYDGLERDATVTLNLSEKDRSLWLTRVEHRGLSKALESGWPNVGDQPPPPEMSTGRLDPLVRVERLIDEDTTTGCGAGATKQPEPES